MDMTNIAIFALIGAICLVVVTGGFLSMSDQDPSPGALGGGAAIGAGLGAAAAYFLGPTESAKLMSAVSQIGGGAEPQMKVGLPSF
jgi:Kef-type K+ transport system membrane component KefB